MVFILGVNIKNSLNIIEGLSKIYGIGKSKSKNICNFLGYSRNILVKDLESKDWENILNFIKNNNIYILKDLIKKERFFLLNLLNMKNYRGIRHKNGLPVRGQRTHSNKKTQKKLSRMRMLNVRKFSSLVLPLFNQITNKNYFKQVSKKTKKKNFKKFIKIKVLKKKWTSVYIFSKYTNILAFIYDFKGNLLNWSSGGSVGFKGKKKATAYSGNLVINRVIKILKDKKLRNIKLKLKGFGPTRKSAVKRFQKKGFFIKSLEDITNIPYNGCRAKKKKR